MNLLGDTRRLGWATLRSRQPGRAGMELTALTCLSDHRPEWVLQRVLIADKLTFSSLAVWLCVFCWFRIHMSNREVSLTDPCIWYLKCIESIWCRFLVYKLGTFSNQRELVRWKRLLVESSSCWELWPTGTSVPSTTPPGLDLWPAAGAYEDRAAFNKV